MSNKTKMENLAREIQEKLEKISSGSGKLEDVQTIYENSQKLYERAVLLKAKAFSGDSITSKSVEEKAQKEIKSDPITEGATEKAIKKEATETSKETSKEMPLFDFTAMPETVNEPVKKESNEEITKEEQPEPKENKPTSTPEKTSETKEKELSVNDHQSIIDSINDHYKNAEDSSLLANMKKKPIENIRTAIGINDKFSYINDLFDGENEIYESALDQLEQLNNADEAKHKLSELAVENEWDLESKTVMQFVELIERRYAQD